MWLGIGIACNTVPADECWVNTSGGLGGAEQIPIGAGVGSSSGDFPASEPQAASGEPYNPCIEQRSPCEQKCEDSQSAAGLECGKIEDVAQRVACQQSAYEAYKICRDLCQRSTGGDCLELCREKCDQEMEKCFKNCPKGDGNCMNECNQQYGRCLKECSKRCK